ncbi:MAG: metal ABC transporter solute-binding protein, Zn/Mn family, partial [Solirubrobacteraceae bacterium]
AGARALGARSVLPDLAFLALIAAAAVAALDAIGALLATAMLVAPAATARLVCHRLGRWQAATAGLAFAQGVVGLGLSVELNAPPGATIAVVGGVVFALVALGRGLARRPRGATALAAGLLALVGAGCGSATGAGRPGAIQVVATTTQLGDIVREVGGRSVQVTQILRPNTDPHDYEPRPQDVAATAHAAVVVVSGDDLDTWMDEVIANAGGDPTVVDAGQGRPDTLPGKTGGPEASRSDPHWWHDPTNVEYAVHRIRAALVRAKPSARSDVEAAAGAYERKVRALDTGVQTCLAAVPAADRKLVTDHDAFGYFAKRYGITVVGAVIPAQTTQAQPSAGEIAALGAVIRREHVKAVFPESSISPRLAEAIARETGASAAHTLYGDTLGSEGSSGATYLSMEEANADAMVRGFTDGRRGCSISGI